MDSFLLRGGSRLKGKIEISGSKNSALPILSACMMAEASAPRKAASSSIRAVRSGGVGMAPIVKLGPRRRPLLHLNR